MPDFSIRKRLKSRLSSFHWILLSFLLLIAIGTFLLMLPISNVRHHSTPFLDCLFTATSASCVTGLTVRDTGTYWSVFGKIVIFCMIQIGGLGLVTMTIALVKLAGRKISLYQRNITQDSLAADHGGGIMKTVYFIIRTTLFFELCGAILLYIPFSRDYGNLKGFFYAIFHSVSAFCNAGFDLLGNGSSLTHYVGDIYVNTVVMLLIISGGLSFATWSDVLKHKHRIRNYSLQSKIILSTSLILIVIPSLFFFFHEYTDLELKERLLASLFQSVTTRTAGFNTTDLSQLSASSKLISMILMMIGGSPGSTAGGLKTTTIALLMISSCAVFTQSDSIHIFKRRISDETVRTASAIFMLYLTIFIVAAIAICNTEKLPLVDCLFEIASAIGTVGLTTGITPLLHTSAHVILILLMFFGRVGCLTLIYALLPRAKEPSKLPYDSVNVG